MNNSVDKSGGSVGPDEVFAEKLTLGGARRTLVLGLGNPLLGDDSAGLRVARELRPRLAHAPGVEVDEDYWGGLRLMERMIGFERAVVVDAMCSGMAPGTVRVLPAEAAATRYSGSAHDVDLCTALEVGRRAGAALPAKESIRVVAVEVDGSLTFTEDCTPEVEDGIARAAEEVVSLLAAWR